MKKKISMIFAIVLVVCMSLTALVACAPKKEEFKLSKGYAFDDIVRAWAKTNGYQGGDTLGIDTKLNIKQDDDMDVTVILQGGLSNKEGSAEGLRLAILDNINSSTTLDIMFDKDNLKVAYKDQGLSVKSLNIANIGLPGLVGGIIGGIGDLGSAVGELLGKDAKVIANKNGETYDVEYHTGIDLTKLSGLIDMIKGFVTIPDDVLNIINKAMEEINPILQKANLDMVVKTTGATREKVEKPKEGQYKYAFVGGKVASCDITLTNGDAKSSVQVEKLDLNAEVPKFEFSVADDKLINIDLQGVNSINNHGKINLLVNGENGKKIQKSFDWKIIAKIDIPALVENNFMLSKMPKDNFFHIQLSHKCDANCEAYCGKNLVSAKSMVLGERYKNTSIIDIAWSPSTMDTSNVFVDISLWDLLTENALDTLLRALLNDPSVNGMGQAIGTTISSQLVLSVDTDALVKSDNTVLPKEAVMAVADGGASIGLDFITKLLNIVVGDKPLIGDLTVKDIVDIAFDRTNGISDIEFTLDATTADDLKEVATYNTYEKAVKFNINGNEKLAKIGSSFNGVELNAYNGFNIMSVLFGQPEKVFGGNPALYVKSINGTDGYANIYKENKGGDPILVASKDDPLTLEEYNANKGKLMVEYTYVGLDKKEATAYGYIFGFNGLDMTKEASQDVELLTSFFTGNSFAKNLTDALADLKLALPMLPDIDINLETIIPAPGDSFGVKVNVGK